MSRQTLNKAPARCFSNVLDFATLLKENVDAMRLVDRPAQLPQGNITHCLSVRMVANGFRKL
jgi:hypothetical protein